MSARARLLFFLGCAAVVALHAPRCLDALAAPDATLGEPAPGQVAALDPDGPEVDAGRAEGRR